ncbi:hypothetical protein E2P84_16165 [Burkholderia cepacia]|uniref:Uncharacterized protein n=1 Tax=Burkholderia cepacia TaxID=292 RepID=A0AAX2RZC3_BURCE|nr:MULTISPECIES: hypothetical protein [Burkholderia]TES75767.1 hypothetical protein E2P84_16165 [Burkholderia cepacia]TEU38953.1 hypothetical protein E3D39_21860 [Burkholderia cepacia]TEU54031.1 hypothetical protein E3D37_02850 [Burkholderia cepacia]TEU57867.1 hypothetical protein E3D38_02140 [Burkholderia cepacia]TEU69015.1 hypothetical protein E3D42_24715 [Burkholderia cepacia]
MSDDFSFAGGIAWLSTADRDADFAALVASIVLTFVRATNFDVPRMVRRDRRGDDPEQPVAVSAGSREAVAKNGGGAAEMFLLERHKSDANPTPPEEVG